MGSLLLVHGCPVLLVTRWVHTLYLPSPLVGIKEAEASSLQRSPLHTVFCVPDTLSQFPLPEQGSPSFLCCEHQSKVAKLKKQNKTHLKCVLEKSVMGSEGSRGEGWGLQGRSWGNSALAIEECLPSPLQKRSTVSEKEKKKERKDFWLLGRCRPPSSQVWRAGG